MSNKLRIFQDHVFNALKEGRSVILQAPTGSGKTRAALYPFLYHLAEQDAGLFPRKCIYSVPMRVLANQFVDKYHETVELYGLKRGIRPQPIVAIQTGDRPDDPKFEATLTFATIDQTLSSFLTVPYSLPLRHANMNAGALLSSYLVFDEFHLFGAKTALPTTLAILDMLKGHQQGERSLIPFVLMTATFSRTMLDRLGDVLDAEVFPKPGDDLAELFKDTPAQQPGRERVFHWHDTELTAEQVNAQRGTRTICICNTVPRANALYDELHRIIDDDTEIRLLHSRFFKRDRDDLEGKIRTIFEPPHEKYEGLPQILVATQVIEVGLDITCDVMFTELAPANSLLQRAGRSARRDNETGTVHVCQPPDYAPYYFEPKRDNAPKDPERETNLTLLTNTRAALASGHFTGRNMDFVLEQALIDVVHTEIDRAMLDHLQLGMRKDKIFATIRDPKNGRGNIPELIRESDTRYVIIHDHPDTDEKLARYPWHYDGFGLRMGTIYRVWKDAEEAGLLDPEIVPWIAKQAVPLETDTDDEGEGQSSPVYKWQKLTDPGELFPGPVALALHPNFAAYTATKGLRLGEIGVHLPPELTQRSGKHRRPSAKYHLETYAEHITGLYRAYADQHESELAAGGTVLRPALRDEISYVVRRLEEDTRFGLRPGLLDEVIRLMIALHDLGKLSVNWQRFAHAWQAAIGSRFYDGEDRSIPSNFMAAHTDFDRSDEAQDAFSRNFRVKRGNHAGESAIAAVPLIKHIAGRQGEALGRAAISAIARHHTPMVDSYTAFAFDTHARSAVEEALQVVGLDDLIAELDQGIAWDVGERKKPPSLVKSSVRLTRNQAYEALLYLLVVRVLRLADQRSFLARR